jgi:hypothetical protein
MNFPHANSDVGEGDWIALAAFLDGDNPAHRLREVASVGYMLAYARQTDADMLAVADGKPGTYKLLFSFDSHDNLFDFLRLLHLNEATSKAEVHLPEASEIRSARPLPTVLPFDLVPQIMQFADVLLSYRDQSLDAGGLA